MNVHGLWRWRGLWRGLWLGRRLRLRCGCWRWGRRRCWRWDRSRCWRWGRCRCGRRGWLCPCRAFPGLEFGPPVGQIDALLAGHRPAISQAGLDAVEQFALSLRQRLSGRIGRDSRKCRRSPGLGRPKAIGEFVDLLLDRGLVLGILGGKERLLEVVKPLALVRAKRLKILRLLWRRCWLWGRRRCGRGGRWASRSLTGLETLPLFDQLVTNRRVDRPATRQVLFEFLQPLALIVGQRLCRRICRHRRKSRSGPRLCASRSPVEGLELALQLLAPLRVEFRIAKRLLEPVQDLLIVRRKRFKVGLSRAVHVAHQEFRTLLQQCGKRRASRPLCVVEDGLVDLVETALFCRSEGVEVRWRRERLGLLGSLDDLAHELGADHRVLERVDGRFKAGAREEPGDVLHGRRKPGSSKEDLDEVGICRDELLDLGGIKFRDAVGGDSGRDRHNRVLVLVDGRTTVHDRLRRSRSGSRGSRGRWSRLWCGWLWSRSDGVVRNFQSASAKFLCGVKGGNGQARVCPDGIDASAPISALIEDSFSTSGRLQLSLRKIRGISGTAEILPLLGHVLGNAGLKRLPRTLAIRAFLGEPAQVERLDDLSADAACASATGEVEKRFVPRILVAFGKLAKQEFAALRVSASGIPRKYLRHVAKRVLADLLNALADSAKSDASKDLWSAAEFLHRGGDSSPGNRVRGLIGRATEQGKSRDRVRDRRGDSVERCVGRRKSARCFV